MKVILTKKVKDVGGAGEIVNVAAGYARNFLVPNELALYADEGNQRKIADYKRRLAKVVDAEKNTAAEMKNKIEGTTLSFIKKVGGNGKLFGTVTTNEIVTELAKLGADVERKQIVLETPIKTLGEFDVKAKLFTDVVAKFKVKVEMSAAQMEEMKKLEAAAKEKKAKAAKEAEEKAAAGDVSEVTESNE